MYLNGHRSCHRGCLNYRDVLYNITRIDVYEGYKNDLTLYCKRRE